MAPSRTATKTSPAKRRKAPAAATNKPASKPRGKPAPEGHVRLTVNLPVESHRKFKAAAAQGITLSLWKLPELIRIPTFGHARIEEYGHRRRHKGLLYVLSSATGNHLARLGKPHCPHWLPKAWRTSAAGGGRWPGERPGRLAPYPAFTGAAGQP
jgi:hypothetical protein